MQTGGRMKSNGRKRPGRNIGTRPLRETIRIVCEGETEKKYFLSMKKECSIRIDLKPELNAGKTKPSQILNTALRLKQDSGQSDVCCVYDLDVISIDDSEKKRYREYRKKAEDNGVFVFESFPCFEIWILLHFTDACGSDTDCSDLIRNHLRKYIPEYEKGSDGLYERLKANQKKAIEKAEKQKRNAGTINEKEMYSRPFTDVHELVQKLLQK